MHAVTSIITLLEILSVNAPESRIRELEKLFSETPNLEVLAVSHEISVVAARIRRQYKFRTPDAIQMATALNSKAKAFITNDNKLKKFKEIKVIMLNELK